MSAQIITAIASVSSVLGVLSLVAYFFFLHRAQEVRRSEQSLRDIVEGDPLFDTRQVLDIIRSFKDEARRLEALKAVLAREHRDPKGAELIYSKIRSNVDLNKLRDTSALRNERLSLAGVALFALIAILAVLYGLLQPNGRPPPEMEKLTIPTPGVILGGTHSTYPNPMKRILPRRVCVDRVVTLVDDKVGGVAHAALEMYIDSPDDKNLIQRHDVPDSPGELTFVVRRVTRELYFISKQRNDFRGEEETRFHRIDVYYYDREKC